MLELCKDYRENVRRVDAELRVDENFDIIKKTLYIGDTEVTLYYIDGFVDSSPMNKLMMYFLSLKKIGDAEDFAQNQVPYVEVETTDTVDTLSLFVLSGAVAKR